MSADPPRPKTLKIPRSVLVIAVTPAGQALLIERADFPGFWQSVTGSQEAGESWSDTATRELMEETGFDATEYGGVIDLRYRNVYCIYPRWRHRYPPDKTHNEERCFAVCVPSAIAPRLAAREHVAYEWLQLDAAAVKATSWSNVAALRHLQSSFSTVVGRHFS